MLTIRLDSPVPLAEQIRLGIRQALATGEIGPGDPLPTVRQLAGDLGVNFNTVARAYRELEQEGLVVTRRGRGTVVRSGSSESMATTPDLARQMGEGFQRLLADGRLAGLRPNDLRRMFEGELARIWSAEELGL